MFCRSGSRPTQVSGESPTYGSVAGNSRISVSVHRELLDSNVVPSFGSTSFYCLADLWGIRRAREPDLLDELYCRVNI